MTGQRWDILGLGAVAVDDLLYVDHYPMPDTKVRIREHHRQGGGLAGTALVAAARQGVKVAYCGVLGDNEESHYALQEFEREGVDCSAVLRRSDAQPFHGTIIVVPATGQRTVLSSAANVVPLRPKQISEALISDCRVLFVDHTVVEAALRATELAHRHNIPVVADLEAERHPRIYDLIPLIDHLILSQSFAQHVTGKDEPGAMVRALAHADRACCVVTSGKRGCWYAEHAGKVKHFPAFQVEPIDTTGCGDVFHGVYAACMARRESIDQAVKLASAAAAIKATQPGGRSGIPTRAKIEDFLTASLDRRSR